MQTNNIGDTWGFSSKTSITLSRSFSIETLTGVTPLWKTELNRSIPAIEDRILGGLQHRPKTCCEKGGCYRRWACMITPWKCNFQMCGLAYDIVLSFVIVISGYYNNHCN